MFENYTNFAKFIGKGILVAGMTVSNWFGVVPSDYFVPPVKEIETKVVHEYLPAPEPVVLGATFVTPDVKALFETSLATGITSSATSMTLVSATDKDGNTLASSTYSFIIDEGTSVEEFVLADCTATACTNMSRGISVSTGTTTVSTLRFAHRRGASVKITDATALIFATNVLKGKQNIENVLRYNSALTFNNSTDIISRAYADSLSFGAVPAASETASGFVELATGIETASSTSSGSIARVVIPASLATSTYNSATAGLRVVVTQNNGKIDSNFINSSAFASLSAQNTFTATTTVATTTATGASNIASTTIVTFAASGTWTKKSNLRYVIVEVVGGGGGGGGSNNAVLRSGGGGSGGYSKKVIVTAALGATETVTVGAAGAGSANTTSDGSAGGTTSFGSHLTATGGSGGGQALQAGGGGGTGSNGDFNSTGHEGAGGIGNSTSFTGNPSGTGGASVFAGYGKGGNSVFNGTGAAGQIGTVTITEVYF